MRLSKNAYGPRLLILWTVAFHPVGANAADQEHTYERASGDLGGGTVKVKLLDEKAARARLVVQVGGIPNGQSTSGDCGFIAEGNLVANVFNGTVTRTNVVADLAPKGDPADTGFPPLVAVVKQDALIFKAMDAAVGKFCGGDGSSLGGVFRLKD
ncbi:hypothetical protein GA0061103_4593 [Rhizobium multihospitium]|uniref:CHRD domain-containing protein n=1 Tax=Rhizobium multihospitium TaxID=410764 RepID=A0A1C3W030_9HYPH|nr:hypothetical protein GA0061103_4593 [Rhizobium multihospitium]